MRCTIDQPSLNQGPRLSLWPPIQTRLLAVFQRRGDDFLALRAVLVAFYTTKLIEMGLRHAVLENTAPKFAESRRGHEVAVDIAVRGA